MQTKQLIQFVAVAKAGNISEAAKQLSIAQPALSQSIIAFEENLQVSLFTRHRRGVELTDAGEILLERAVSILQQLDNTREMLREIDGNPSGDVSIGFPASVANVLVEPICNFILANYPGIRLQIEEGLTGNLGRVFRAGNMDLMVDFDVDRHSEFRMHLLIEEELFFVGANLNNQRNIKFSELNEYELTLPTRQHAMGKAITRYENECGIELRRVPLLVGVHPLVTLLRSGSCYSILPWSMIHGLVDKKELRARKVVEPKLVRRAFLIRPRGRTDTTAVKIVRQAIFDAVKCAHRDGKWRGRLLLDTDDD